MLIQSIVSESEGVLYLKKVTCVTYLRVFFNKKNLISVNVHLKPYNYNITHTSLHYGKKLL